MSTLPNCISNVPLSLNSHLQYSQVVSNHIIIYHLVQSGKGIYRVVETPLPIQDKKQFKICAALCTLHML